ncbi:MAG: ABC transporter ATP-binding protein/permease [Firmicutes bacterium]|nr:ABC transporter ATP-binding protein/permease [Bacillota bacterium]
MKTNKYNLATAVRFCFKYGPGAASIKLLAEITTGTLMPLMVLVVASFINNAVLFAHGYVNLVPLILAIILMAAYYAYIQVSQIIVRLADKSLENSLRENLRPQLVQKQARTSFPLLENPETLDLISRVCDNAEGQVMAIFNSGTKVARLGIQIFGVLFLLVTHIWWIVPMFVLSTIPIVFIARKGGRKIFEMFRVSTKLTRRHYYLSDILVGREAAAERALFGYAHSINNKFSAIHLQRSNLVTKALAIEEASIHGCGFIINLLVLAAVFALLSPVSDGTMSLGLYVSLVGALIGLAKIITETLSRLVRDATEYGEYMRDFTRFFALRETDDADTNGDSSITFNSLEIRGLRFRYTADSPYILDGVNLTIEKGKSYSLIGHNGAGKTTLTKILLGLYRDFEGEILVNGADIAKYSTEELRCMFSIVYQDFARYFIPLGDNITLGNTSGDFHSSLRLAELDDVIVKLPQKENTPLGKIFDGGMDISGGEWQKVAIARALYANTPFMILDEPTASLSPMMESKLYKRFSEITNEKTSLLISHRLGSTKLSDVLFVLDKGIIAETGTHDELMATNGIYAQMFKSQRSWYDER